MREERYLGDGLYASYDGWQVRLRAPRSSGDHEVYLDPVVMQAFIEYVLRIGMIRKTKTTKTREEREDDEAG